jgi:hypothetical protein
VISRAVQPQDGGLASTRMANEIGRVLGHAQQFEPRVRSVSPVPSRLSRGELAEDAGRGRFQDCVPP